MSAGWRAELALGYEQRNGRTVLAKRRQLGPLLVQRPFYPEPGGVCHTLLLHPPGGVVGGDELDIRVDVAPGAAALLTTPAAGKLYRSQGAQASIRQTLQVADQATLEWLPQENIAFAGAQARSMLHVSLAATARFVGWEMLCLGRPAAGERFSAGDLTQRLEVEVRGRPLLREQGHYVGGGEWLEAPWGLGGCTVTGTLVAVPGDAALVACVRAGNFPAEPGERLGVTALEGVLVARYLGAHAQRARAYLAQVWALLRPALLGRPACPPRIWQS